MVLLLSSTLFVFPTKAYIVDSSWVDSIESYTINIDSNTTAEIVVCVFQSLYGHGIKDNSGQEINDIIQLGVYVFNDMPLDIYDGTQTGIGKTGKDNGVLVLVALDERQWRIEVGYGLEGDITDIETNLIAQQYLVPAFRDGNYGEGLYDTVVALGEQIPTSNQLNNVPVRGYYYEATSEQTTTSTPFWNYNFYGMPLWLIVVLALLGVFGGVFGGKTRGGRSGGGGSTGKW
jgi:TPM domain